MMRSKRPFWINALAAAGSWFIITLLSAGMSWGIFISSPGLPLSIRVFVAGLTFVLLFVMCHLFFLPLWHLGVRLLSGETPGPVRLGEGFIVDVASLLAAIVTWGMVFGGSFIAGAASYNLCSPIKITALCIGFSVLLALIALSIGIVLAEPFYKILRFVMSGGLTTCLHRADDEVVIWRLLRLWQQLAHRLYPVHNPLTPEEQIRLLVTYVLDGSISSYDQFVKEAGTVRIKLSNVSTFEELLAILGQCSTDSGEFSQECISSHLKDINTLIEKLSK
ncbi:MAG: hypothetical protein KatS3mg022_2001 [Armatimonadota bacterium]|nr:MAG: hypothetical protein KatS3mg022_2001 [Armatimonadota bacterium]